jgi:hypothetical protein
VFYPQLLAMTRFNGISDVYGTSNRFTISNSIDLSGIKKFGEKSRYFGFSWMTQSQIHSGVRGAIL